MKNINSQEAMLVRENYPLGLRLELLIMSDPNQSILTPGIKGTVVQVDADGTIHVVWDCKTLSGVVYEEDTFRIISAK
jgi:hypothetical protein